MCEHKYKDDPNKKCPYPELFRKWRELQKNNSSEFFEKFGEVDLELLVDEQGECIFHSEDADWKRKNGFLGRFRDLVEVLNWDEDINEMDFEEFVFVSDKKNQKIDLNGITFSDFAYFENATFSASADFENATFSAYANFENANFSGYANFKNAKFLGHTEFLNTTFSDKHTIFFNNIKVKKILNFQGTKEQKIFRHNVYFDIKPENIEGEIIFEDANIFWIFRNDLNNLKKISQESERKIKFGEGCEKYRFKKSILINVKPERQNAKVTEGIITAFKNFFNLTEKKNFISVDYT